MEDHSYIAIDLKSFYASVECMDRGLDPLTTHLVVADPTRTRKTICLAVSPALKEHGVPGRPRLFEVDQQVQAVNALRRESAPGRKLTGASSQEPELLENSALALDFIVAPPRMAHYMEISTQIYQIYLEYVAAEDIHVYSVDEVFLDVTGYLGLYRCTARELATRMVRHILEATGVSATAGIGTNLYLCKVAMDIMAKHCAPDASGCRIAELDELSYRRELWSHRPLTDFWRVGRGYARRLEAAGLFTMGDIARCSLGGPEDFYNEELLYRMFGVNAELLIDHAWGWEPCTIADIKAYRPASNSLSIGQVLQSAYDAETGRIIVREMAGQLAMDLTAKGLVTDQVVLTVGYDIENLTDPKRRAAYHGPVVSDHYGRSLPKHAHGSEQLGTFVSSAKRVTEGLLRIYDRTVDRELLIRRIYVVAAHVTPRQQAEQAPEFEQLDLFQAMDGEDQSVDTDALDREARLQEAVLDLKQKFGKNAVIKGTSLREGATARERNRQIGGHKA